MQLHGGSGWLTVHRTGFAMVLTRHTRWDVRDCNPPFTTLPSLSPEVETVRSTAQQAPTSDDQVRFLAAYRDHLLNELAEVQQRLAAASLARPGVSRQIPALDT